MNQATISQLKNHLPQLVHEVETGEDIHITRHGKAVAVIISLERYKQVFSAQKGVFSAYLRWRNVYPEASGLTDDEIKALRDQTPLEPKHSIWDE